MDMCTGATPGDSGALRADAAARVSEMGCRTAGPGGATKKADGTTPESAMLDGARHGVAVADATGASARSSAIPDALPTVAAGHRQERDVSRSLASTPTGEQALRRRSRTPPASDARPSTASAPPVPGQGGVEIGPSPAPTDCGKLAAVVAAVEAVALPDDELLPEALVPMVPLLVL